ncbi:hypothetical protein HDEF_0896 [Candidatus Hamiltonella defensa 5AT (Acyrthosiphon pisum)]|uniref:Uncharacterized protein n=1 Tax=Hamiltonella defensa subsp. Acyrthosiphon pisum (strain 5AT) TaxID=572265 RepID=C4K4W9_HAMD5|nr:hypothetical protein HDEF_0896 [Candidatus Hamiltonella defensa 5AT (Acyrthosiphon pisum)]
MTHFYHWGPYEAGKLPARRFLFWYLQMKRMGGGVHG